jgi:8-oxo-dGTP pyrophosphatase MutT (NUDIX family)
MEGKVTALVVRGSRPDTELLLFQHPYAGIQLPAGTIEPGETPEAAAVREATEETGLMEFDVVQPLGHRDEVLPENRRMIVQPTTVYSRPDAGSFDWVRIRSGIAVRQEREQGEFVQITYEEWDRHDTPGIVSFRITGWALASQLATGYRRHFFLLRYNRPTPERWTVETDNHRFELFWAPIRTLPTIISSQAHWVAMLPPALT